MTTKITATYDHENGDVTTRAATFDVDLPARACELIGYGLLWEHDLSLACGAASVTTDRDGGNAAGKPCPDLSGQQAAVYPVGSLMEVIVSREAELAEALGLTGAAPWDGMIAELRKRLSSEAEVQRVDEPEQDPLAVQPRAAVTVDTSVCSFADAARNAIELAATRPRVGLLHNSVTAAVYPEDSVTEVTERWQREADHDNANRSRTRNDGRSRLAHDLRAAGFGSAGWAYGRSDSAITLSMDDAGKLLSRPSDSPAYQFKSLATAVLGRSPDPTIHASEVLDLCRERLTQERDETDRLRTQAQRDATSIGAYLAALARTYLAIDPSAPANPDGTGEWDIHDPIDAATELRARVDQGCDFPIDCLVEVVKRSDVHDPPLGSLHKITGRNCTGSPTIAWNGDGNYVMLSWEIRRVDDGSSRDG